MLNCLSVTNYQATVARTPKPTRFDGRHQRILQSSKLRLARVSRIAQKDDTCTDGLQNRPQRNRNCPLGPSTVAIPQDIKPPKSPAILTTFNNTTESGQADLAEYELENGHSQRSCSDFEDESTCSYDQVEVGLIQSYRYHPDIDAEEEESGMFISTHSIDFEPGSADLERDIRQLFSQDYETGSTCHGSRVDKLLSHKKEKLRQLTPANLQSKAANVPPGIVKAIDERRSSRPLRRAPVNELVLYKALDVLAPVVDIHCEESTLFEDEDLIEDSDYESKVEKGPHASHNLSKSRKRRRNAKYDIPGATLDDLSEFKMPKLLETSAGARERFRISLNCCDGFTRHEVRPTGKQRSMAFLSHRRKRFKAESKLVPALTLVSQRPFGDYVLNSQEDSEQTYVCLTNNVNPINRTYKAASEKNHLPEDMVTSRAEGISLARFNQDTPPDVSQRMLRWQQITDEGGKYPKPAKDLIQPPKSSLRSRLVLNVEEEVLKSLSMISAPIARLTSDSSNSSSEGADERTVDGDCTDSETTDEDRSIESKDEANNKDSDLDTDKEAEVNQLIKREMLQHPKVPTKVAVQMMEAGVVFTPRNDMTVTQAVQKLAISGESISHNGNAGFDDLLNPSVARDDLDLHRYQMQEAPKNTIGLRQEPGIPDQFPWMPRRPVSSHFLVEVDEDVDDTSSPVTTQLRSSLMGAYHPVRSLTGQTRFSQGSVELGDPNWSTPCYQTEEAPESQSQSSQKWSDGYKGMSRQRPFVQTFQQLFHAIPRSATMPPISRSTWSTESAKVEQLEISSTSKKPVRFVRGTAMIPRSSLVPATAWVRRRIQSLPLKPPFLKT